MTERKHTTTNVGSLTTKNGFAKIHGRCKCGAILTATFAPASFAFQIIEIFWSRHRGEGHGEVVEKKKRAKPQGVIPWPA